MSNRGGTTRPYSLHHELAGACTLELARLSYNPETSSTEATREYWARRRRYLRYCVFYCTVSIMEAELLAMFEFP